MCFAELSFTWAQLAPQMGVFMASGAGGHMHGLCKDLHGEHSMIWFAAAHCSWLSIRPCRGVHTTEECQIAFLFAASSRALLLQSGIFWVLGACVATPLACQCRETRGEVGLQHLPAAPHFEKGVQGREGLHCVFNSAAFPGSVSDLASLLHCPLRDCRRQLLYGCSCPTELSFIILGSHVVVAPRGERVCLLSV